MTSTGSGQHYRRAIGLGLLGGVVVIYLALVGIMERFAERPVITDVLTLGLFAPALALLVLAYRATVPPRTWVGPPLTPLQVMGTALTAGLAGGALTATFLFINEAVDLTGVFVNAGPSIAAILSLGLTPVWLGPLV
ncbi:MAG TPA: hypothetical protein VIH24_03925, partial [Candidatus Limnocylindria bacterium]